jgi:hypothetical protein
VDNDGKDELLVGQTNSPTSETIFHLLDINEEGNVESRIAYAGFTPRFRGDGGVNLHVCDLNGDGKKEILVASMGNSGNHGDDRDSAPRNLMGIIIPIITNAQVTGFQRAARGVFNVFTEEDNPSGGFSITAGELNGNTEDGDEVVVGTSAMYDIDGFSITPRMAAPESRYRIMKISFDGSTFGGLQNVIGGIRGFNAYVDRWNPLSSAINVAIIPNLDIRFPFPFPTPPKSIYMGTFTLAVQSYSTYKWQNDGTRIVNATGIAWTSFNCVNKIVIPDFLDDFVLVRKNLQIVDTVRNPQTEISLQEALRFDKTAQLNTRITLMIPQDYVIREQIRADELLDHLKIEESLLDDLVPVMPLGDIKLKFENLTIDKDIHGNWIATGGTACYPSDPPVVPPNYISLNTAGFTTRLYSFCISPSSATAEAELVLPSSLIAGADCSAATLALGEIDINSTCQYYKELPDTPYGPWFIDRHGMIIHGTGFVADFSKLISWAGWTGNPALTPAWRGVVIMGGETIPADPDTTLSNIGYLKALLQNACMESCTAPE